MKNKTPKDPFDTYCWSYAVITDPYQVFAECFMFADIGAFRKSIRQVLASAAEDEVYKKEQPASALNMFKAITSVMLAAQALCRQKKTSGLKIEQQQFTDKRLYARPGTCCAEWEYLPRHLSAKEYQDPIKYSAVFLNIRMCCNGGKAWSRYLAMHCPAIQRTAILIC